MGESIARNYESAAKNLGAAAAKNLGAEPGVEQEEGEDVEVGGGDSRIRQGRHGASLRQSADVPGWFHPIAGG